MDSNIEYALMAGRAYQSTRENDNLFPIPPGWVELEHDVVDDSVFEAVYFKKGNDIVISFAGTYDKDPGDIDADIGLASGTGSIQLLQAAEYYLATKAVNPEANPTDITQAKGYQQYFTTYIESSLYVSEEERQLIRQNIADLAA